MKTIKASLRMNKKGRLYCTLHQTYKVATAPKNGCTICWTLYQHTAKQTTIDVLKEALLKGKQNESH